jgi:hypothetical protein
MDVGIITLFRSHNNGAVLQAYALQRVVQGLGHKPSIIDYYPASVKENNRIFKSGFNLAALIRNGYALARYAALKRLSDRFDGFIQEHLPLSRQYQTATQLEQDSPKFDAYICGSDQVWNPQREKSMGRPYFLSFVPPGCRRIAYAPSFGVDAIDPARYDEFAQHINAINHLSVREVQGQAIIKQLTGRDALLALDPTLLLSVADWQKLASPITIQEPYILIYCVMAGQIAELATKVKQVTGLKTAAIFPALRPIPIPGVDFVLNDVGPAQFIGLFNQAAGIVTNTFHGAAFSIINRKPFLVTPATNPARLISLLGISGLSAHYLMDVSAVKTSAIPALMSSELVGISDRLQQHQQQSLAFLTSALSTA